MNGGLVASVWTLRGRWCIFILEVQRPHATAGRDFLKSRTVKQR